MPSILLGVISGGTNILSGNYWSGQGGIHPVGGIQLLMNPSNSGIVYVACSGGVTIRSGGFQASGLSGGMDGMPIGPGVGYFIPKLEFIPSSGNPTIFCQPDANCSGQAVVFFEIF